MSEQTEPNKPRVMYSSNGKQWQRVEWAPQCSKGVFFNKECQGVEGHTGVHWCYDEHGSFVWSENKEELTEEQLANNMRGSSGTCPPGHKEYTNPVGKQEDYYMSHSTVTEVTDPDIITALDRDEPPEKNASITKPVPLEEIERLGLQDRIPKWCDDGDKTE